MESVLYLLFMQERTQKEAIEFMYGKEYSDVNVVPFKKARENLMSDNLLSSDGSLRNASFRSNTDYFLSKIEEKASERGKEISSEELEGIQFFLNSDWFRSFFELEYLENMQGIARNSNGVLEVTNEYEGAFELVIVVFDDLGIIGADRSFDELLNYNSVTEFLEDQDWNLSISREKTMEMIRDEIEDSVRGDFLEWRLFFLRKIIEEYPAIGNLPSLNFPVFHWNSDLAMARRFLDRKTE
ncbi:MAG: hypothetical protein ABEI78_01885 [Candidatus Nanohaloarchaea archaeon]